MAEVPEPWLRGPIADVHPLILPVLFSFAQVREDLHRHVSGLTDKQVWHPFAKSSVGFHLKHMSGSIDRLGTYLIGGALTMEQLRDLRDEKVLSGTATELIADVHQSLSGCEARLQTLNPDHLFEVRTVGRAHLPTTVLGLLVHIPEHTQRHLGQAITLSQIARLSGAVSS